MMLQAVSSNISWNYLVNMRDYLLPVSFLSLFTASSYGERYNNNVVGMRLLIPKIGIDVLYLDG